MCCSMVYPRQLPSAVRKRHTTSLKKSLANSCPTWKVRAELGILSCVHTGFFKVATRGSGRANRAQSPALRDGCLWRRASTNAGDWTRNFPVAKNRRRSVTPSNTEYVCTTRISNRSPRTDQVMFSCLTQSFTTRQD